MRLFLGFIDEAEVFFVLRVGVGVFVGRRTVFKEEGVD